MYDELFQRLAKSDFRSKFKLKPKDREYLEKKGLEVIESHARDFIAKRIAPANIPNDTQYLLHNMRLQHVAEVV